MDWQDRYFAAPDGLRLHYRDYATAHTRSRLPVLCLPGLTRNCRDFEDLAPRLGSKRRVIAADLRGRGLSARDPDWRRYRPDIYLADIAALLDAAGAERVVIVGTSLGGLLAMLFAAVAPARVAAVVLNDIGPEVDPVGRARIAAYVGRSPAVRNWDEAAAQCRATYGVALPGLDDRDWIKLARRAFREVDGVPELDMDPLIGEAVRKPPPGVPQDLWAIYPLLRTLPMLTLRGELSDVLSPATVARMQSEKPDLVVVTVPRRGHPPLLDEPQSQAALDAFLSGLP